MAKSVTFRILISIAIVLLWLMVFIVGSLNIFFRGPSTAARDLLVSTLMETSAAKFVVKLYFTDDEIESILQKNTVMVGEAASSKTVSPQFTTDDVDFDINDIVLKDVSGPTYKGKLLIVNDPSRVYVASPAQFETEAGGLRVEEMVARDNATAGINAGAFADENGVGNGGTPLGIVIQNGVLTFGSSETHSSIVGFDKDGKLVVGEMSAKTALERGVRDAVSFPTPALITDGKPAATVGTGGGLNPRTAIGQRADGAVLMLVIDGRQAHSIGASYKDIIDVMLANGAVTAGNLDGGSSTLLVYENQIQNVCASLYGSRKLPTAMLVRQVQQ